MMKTVNIEEIEIGQIVAEPVRNKFRQIILSQGSLITDSHKHILKTWNINQIKIITENGSEEDMATLNDISIEAHRIVSSRYNWVPTNKWEHDLINATVKKEIINLLNMNI